MGTPKALLVVDGTRLVDRALGAATGFPTVLVASPVVAAAVDPRPGLTVVVNDQPSLGMRRSLALADARILDRDAALAVLLVDTPLVDRTLVGAVAGALGGADVAFPVRDGIPGHPVVFGPRARSRIADLPDGDSLRVLRDDPGMTRVPVPVDGDAPFVDVDSPSDLAALGERLAAERRRTR